MLLGLFSEQPGRSRDDREGGESFAVLAVQRLEAQPQRPLYVALKIRAAISAVRDPARVRVEVPRNAEGGVGQIEVDVVKQIHQFESEFEFAALGDTHLFEH